MRVIHRGLTVELEAADPRVEQIERLLFGFLQPPDESSEPAAPPPAPPQGFERFWDSLERGDRYELSLLAERAWPVAELERKLGYRGNDLNAHHSVIGRKAKKAGEEFPIRSTGRGRASRRFFLSDEVAGWVRHLCERPRPGWM